MNSYQVYIYLVLGIVLLTIVTSMISSFLNKKHLISKIDNLYVLIRDLIINLNFDEITILTF